MLLALLIWDVAIEGVSLIQTYRAQFDRIIKRGSFPEAAPSSDRLAEG